MCQKVEKSSAWLLKGRHQRKEKTMENRTRTDSTNPPMSVECPAWLRRQMVRNLQKAANERINPGRAKKAANILAMIKAESDVVSLREQSDAATTKKAVDTGKATAQLARTLGSRIRQSAFAVFR